ncbi:MAG TPA: DNA-3-methyladenine glycosylase I [Candidatus Bathyarchaeia archaeon]|nr:DNA-3-methyladenine glycosylase I [Candidatus Bathyarchaeia archaeon]
MDSARTSWFKRSGKPLTNDEVFENLTRVIFQGGLSWDIIQRKWPSFQQAFANFSIDDVVNFTEDDIANLIENKDIIRNSVKIEATLHNAKELQKITEGFGSFFKYLDSIGREKNYAVIIKDLTKRMKRLGKKSSYIFLYSIGENIEWDIE